MCGAKGHVRFTPNSDRKSGHDHCGMAALPLKAELSSATWDVRFGPKADIVRLFDHHVGAGKYCWRNCEAEGLRGLEIDHQLKFVRSLHWQVGGLLSLEDAIDVAGRAPVLVDKIRPIGD